MRGADPQQPILFSYVAVEDRIPAEHPLRVIRALVEPILADLSPRFQQLYARIGRPSIPPEQLLRALLLQVLYTVRSERQLMEQLNYNLLFRWFVGLNPDDAVWVPTVFSKNRDRLLAGDLATAFLQGVLQQAETRQLLSDDHFTVDGTLLEAWASHKSLRPLDAPAVRRRSGQSQRQFPGRAAVECDASLGDRSRCAARAEGPDRGGPVSSGQRLDGESARAGGRHRCAAAEL